MVAVPTPVEADICSPDLPESKKEDVLSLSSRKRSHVKKIFVVGDG
jgi:hypothetical protein